MPWVHNVRNTDMVCAVDDDQCMDLLRLFNEEAGQKSWPEPACPASWSSELPLLGISSICNLVAAIKTAKYYDMDGRDVIFMPLTDSADLYSSRLAEMTAEQGAYDRDHGPGRPGPLAARASPPTTCAS